MEKTIGTNDSHTVFQTQVSRAIRHYVKLAGDDFSYDCRLCPDIPNKKTTSGKKKSNLVNHLKSVHPDVYAQEILYKHSTKYYAVKRLQLLQQCVEITTVNKEPFNCLLKTGFQKMIEPKVNKLFAAGFGINLRRPELKPVKNHIAKTAAQIRRMIKKEIKGRLLAVMIDVGTKNHKSILAVSIQFIDDDGTTKVRSIGMVELKKSHTGANLAAELKKCLDEYKIKLRQVVAITRDNAANMGRTIREINIFCENAMYNASDQQLVDRVAQPQMSESTATNEQPDDNTDTEIASLLEDLSEVEEEILDHLLDDSNDYENLLSELVKDFQAKYGANPIYVNSVNCAAHTLQLAVHDALKMLKQPHINVINLCRYSAKFLRKQCSIHDMEENDIKVIFPRLDTKTRWSSTYYLVGYKYFF